MARRRDYKAEYRRRQELARTRGFKGYWQQRTTPRTPRGGGDLRRLPEKAREGRREALSVIHLAREMGVSVEVAAKLRGVPMQRVRWYAGDALGQTRNGKTMPTRADRMARLRPDLYRGRDDRPVRNGAPPSGSADTTPVDQPRSASDREALA